MRRPVALLDVDDTLIFSNHKLNQTFLTALKEKNITDLYLFTDMTFKKNSINDRETLIKTLTEQGFKVHAVITPNDLIWNLPPKEAQAIQTLYQYCFDGSYTGPLTGKLFIKLIETRVPILAPIIKNYDPHSQTPGQSYQDALSVLQQNVGFEDIVHRSMMSKAFGDCLAENHGYQHTKGLLLDFFLCHQPDWVSSIVIADDNEQVKQSIEQFKPVTSDIAPPLLTFIEVKGLNMENSYYTDKLQQHLDNDYIATISHRIEKQIQLLKSKHLLFKDHHAIQDLRSLQTALSNRKAAGKTFEAILEDWSCEQFEKTNPKQHVSLKTIPQILFPCIKHTHCARENLSFLNQLKQEFGDRILSGSEEQEVSSYSI